MYYNIKVAIISKLKYNKNTIINPQFTLNLYIMKRTNM